MRNVLKGIGIREVAVKEGMVKTFMEVLWDGPGYYAPASREPMYDGSPRVSYFPLAARESVAADREARDKGLGTPAHFEDSSGFDRVN